MKITYWLLAIGAFMAMAVQASGESWQNKFLKVSDEYIDQVYFKYSPSIATISGVHQFDEQLEDFSQKSIDSEVSHLKKILKRLEELKRQRDQAIIDKHKKIPAGAPGSNGVEFKALLSAKGEIRVLGIARQDSALTAEQVARLEKEVYAFQYHPYKLNGVTVETPTNVDVYLDSVEPPYDPVYADMQIVESTIHSQLLNLETIRMWQKDPDSYSSTAATGVFTIIERNYAPAEQRLRAVIAREKQMPALFNEARTNLKNPPRIYTEIAIDQLPGIIDFFQSDVPQAFAEVKDPELNAEFSKTNNIVVEELRAYLSWLKTDLLPRSKGDFRIGADAFARKLEYDEMVDTPLDRLLEIGRADLKKNQSQFNAIASELDPKKTPRGVLEELGSDHPAPDQLLDSFRATFASLQSFIRTHHIVTLPSNQQPILEETPPFMRATTFAAMDTPGPFEAGSTDAYFDVTLPDKSMTPAQVESYMHSFNVGTIISTSVHEAFPGHFVQFLFAPRAPSRVRKLLTANTNVEGWAHYCEQMMLDEGYGQPGTGAKNEREAKLFKLGQLQDALLRDARFIVGIEMHTGKMDLDQAVAFFEKEGYQSHETALVETRRGTSDPTYLYYTLGKLEIMKLREDVKKKEGASFSLQKFHDDFLAQGAPPIKIVREAMLGNDTPALQ